MEFDGGIREQKTVKLIRKFKMEEGDRDSYS